MSRNVRLIVAALGVLVTAALVWLLFIALPSWTSTPEPEPDEVVADPRTAPPPATAARPRIKARLFYVSADGRRLESVEREVEFGATTAAQARHLVEAQLRPVQEPLVSAIPEGSTLREVFVTERGEAYVDLSTELARNHTGGSLDEILTVYTIVGALTENLPGVSSVQILIDGREVDTLAGHVDLRRPLGRNPEWFVQPEPTPAPAPATGN
jgi:Sporulation and spore germination